MSKSDFNLEYWQSQFFGHILNLENNFTQLAKPVQGMSIDACAQIYQKGYKARLTEVLGDTFEATWWALGDELFFSFANEFISNIPSRSYDLSDYGIEFPQFIESQVISSEIPFLSGLARFEWLFKTVFHEPDIVDLKFDVATILSENPDAKINLNRQVHFFSSEYSVYDIWKKRAGDVASTAELNWEKSQYLVLFKKNNQIHSVQLEMAEYDLLSCFCEPSSLEEAVINYSNKSGEFKPEYLQRLFAKVAQYQILSGAR